MEQLTLFSPDSVPLRNMRPRFLGILLFLAIILITSIFCSGIFFLALRILTENGQFYFFNREYRVLGILVPYVGGVGILPSVFLVVSSILATFISVGLIRALVKKIQIQRKNSTERTFWDTIRVKIYSLFMSWVIVQLALWFFDGRH